MEFCPYCSNYLYIKVDQTQKNDEDGTEDDQEMNGEGESSTMGSIHHLINYCKNCDYQKTNTSTSHILLSSINLNQKDADNYSHYLTVDIKHDPTLPRVSDIPCPSEECRSNNKDKTSEVIFIKYDKDNMKYLYHCVLCEKFWTK